MSTPDPQAVLSQQRADLCRELLNLEPLYIEPEIDPVDAARDSHRREEHVARRGHLRRRLDEVDEALLRLETGGYGRCAWCGCEISAARLKAYPTAVLCIECEREAEAEE